MIGPRSAFLDLQYDVSPGCFAWTAVRQDKPRSVVCPKALSLHEEDAVLPRERLKSPGKQRDIGKNRLGRVNQVRPGRSHMSAVVLADSERGRSGSRYALCLLIETQRALRLLPPADLIALFLETTGNGITICGFRFQRLERSSE